LDQLGSNQCAFNQRSADHVADHQDFVKGDDVAGLGVELFDLDDVVSSNLVLLAARLDDSKSHMHNRTVQTSGPYLSRPAAPRLSCQPVAVFKSGAKVLAGSLEQRFQTKPAHRTDRCAWIGRLSGKRAEES